jgi:hypothetical protein
MPCTLHREAESKIAFQTSKVWEFSMKYEMQVEEEVSTWPQVSVHSHRFGGREFHFGKAEIGHVHVGGIVDVPFTRAIHDVLLTEGLAEEHRWVPDSGWITFQIRNEEELQHALWLMRLSYLRYALKKETDPHAFLDQECERLKLASHFRSLLEKFVPTNVGQAGAE